MENRSDDLSNEDDLPVPGTDESTDDASTEEAGGGPGNVSVDEPTAATLEGDAGSPGGAEEADASGEDDDTSEGTSDDGGEGG